MTLRFFGLFLFFPVLFPFVSHLSSPRTSHRALPLHGDPCRCTVPKRKQLTYSLHLSTGCVILSPAYAWNCTTHQGIAPIDGLKVGAYYQPDTVRLNQYLKISLRRIIGILNPPGGIGRDKSVVSFSAICAHKLSHPSRNISFINYRPVVSTVCRSQ